jgi:hypothetical protein
MAPSTTASSPESAVVCDWAILALAFDRLDF